MRKTQQDISSRRWFTTDPQTGAAVEVVSAAYCQRLVDHLRAKVSHNDRYVTSAQSSIEKLMARPMADNVKHEMLGGILTCAAEMYNGEALERIDSQIKE